MKDTPEFADVLSGRQQTVSESQSAFLTRSRSKVALVAGYLAVTFAVFVAHDAAATAYEVSIYWATPLAFWLLVGAALVVGVTTAIYQYRTFVGRLGLLLTGTSVVSVLALPLVRGYHYYGLTDGMNHLGFTRKLAVGIRGYFDLIYPGGHSTALLFDAVSGVGVPRALMLVVFICLLVFVLFVPLAVRELVPHSRAVVLAVFAGLLIMPINNVATTPQFHSFTLAALLSPIAFYLLFTHLSHGAEDDALPGWLSAVSIVLPLTGLGLLLYHPQAMFDVVVIVVAIAALQFAFRLWNVDSAVTRTRPVYGMAVFLFLAFYVWNSQHWQASATYERTMTALQGYLEGTTEAAPNVESTGQSASEIGASLPELFVKLFLVESLFTLAAVVLVVWNLFGRLRLREKADTAVTFLSVGALLLLPYFLTQMLGEVAHNFFRHLGFGMVLVSILAPIALAKAWHRYGSTRLVRPALVVGVTVCLVLSMVALFPSPFIYLYNHQASDQHMAGWENTFQYQPANEPKPLFIGTVGLVPSRYENALAAKPGTPWYPGLVKPFPRGSVSPNNEELQHLTEFYATHEEQIVHRDHYFVVSAVDRKRSVVAYDELRYTEESFRSITAQEDVHRVHANGEFNGYYVDLPPPPGVVYNATGTDTQASARRAPG
jgi:hypothetical protein